AQWRCFWQEPLISQVRNLWFRALHQSLSCKSVLHSILPHIHPTNTCLICNCNNPDTIFHFLYICPVKWAIWSRVWSDLFLSSLTHDAVHHATFSLPFPSIQSRISSHTIIAYALHRIWSAHWRFAFDNIPFEIDL
ncbi:hypothetical protein BDA99DRAFT_426352, partial [Phascolomyces articulosus]